MHHLGNVCYGCAYLLSVSINAKIKDSFCRGFLQIFMFAQASAFDGKETSFKDGEECEL